jgi:hypothetical protein
MGWDTFHLVLSVWLTIIDMPMAAPINKWELQASRTPAFAVLYKVVPVISLLVVSLDEDACACSTTACHC